MSAKITVMETADKVKDASGRDLEQLLIRAIILYLLFGEQAAGII